MGKSRDGMVRFALWMPVQTKERAAELAKEMGMTVTAYLNMAISNELKTEGARGLGFLILEKGSKELKEHLKWMKEGLEKGHD